MMEERTERYLYRFLAPTNGRPWCTGHLPLLVAAGFYSRLLNVSSAAVCAAAKVGVENSPARASSAGRSDVLGFCHWYVHWFPRSFNGLCHAKCLKGIADTYYWLNYLFFLCVFLHCIFLFLPILPRNWPIWKVFRAIHAFSNPSI
ncbi:hypothetical protein SAMN05192553_101112 [Cyclobacterium xiamenense]|uniref:Uncharacterized protein n=1 Tax=Cyclobacterium xiamenense TaxID=1297121 RepID=A0A1H6T5B6_9BACT|nr:hypothetical protein SAMN05192553_101112 [Cyclobacterium xiamenense]